MRSSLVSRAPALLLAWTAAAAGCGDDETGTVTDSGTTAGSTTDVETTAGTSDGTSDGTTVGETDTGETDTDTDTGGIVCVADPPPEA